MTAHSAPSRSHIIVGDGITALAFVDGCDLGAGDTLTLVGKSASQLGRGIAYAKGEPGTPWRYAYLLNSPADDIDPAFATWLGARWDALSETMAGRRPNWLGHAAPLVEQGDVYGVNAPREIYGDYMEELAGAALGRLRAKGVRVETVDDTARVIAPRGDGVEIRLGQGRTLFAHSADIAPGGPSTLRIAGDDGPFAAPTVFGQEHRIAEHITAGAEIFCIGGNAAMLDVLRLCQSLIPEAALRFVACAPDGEIPAPLIPRLPRTLTTPTLSHGHATAQSFLAEIRREIDAALARGEEMREIRAGFRAHFLANPLPGYVETETEALKVPATLRFWLRGGTRDTILDMRRLVGEGRARMIKGAVKAIEPRDGGATVVIRDETGAETRHATGFVVNCAGAGPGSTFDALTEDMLSKGFLDRCPISRGLRVGPNCRTGLPSVRHLSPATTVIGEEPMALPLYDAHMLRTYAARATAR